MNSPNFSSDTPREAGDDTGRPAIFSPVDIFLDTEAQTEGLFTMAFIFGFSTTVPPRSLLLSRGPAEKAGEVWVEPDDPERGFTARGMSWTTDGLLLTLELTDGHTFYWDGSTRVTIELMETRMAGVNTCLNQIFVDSAAEIADIARQESDRD